MSKKNVEENKTEYLSLCKELRELNIQYDEGKPAISDVDYDKKIRGVYRLLEKAPTLIDLDSFPNTIGYLADDGEEDTPLPVKMYSTDNLYTWEEFIAWIRKYLPLGRLIVTEKNDGIAMSLIIKAGVLTDVATRGDGTTGKNMNHLKNLFKDIKFMKGDYVIHGEFIGLRTLMDLGNYVNLRSAANSARQKIKVKPGLKKHVSFIAYNLIKEDGPKSYEKKLEVLRSMKLKTPGKVDHFEHIMGDNVAKVLYQALEKRYAKRYELDYDIDGFVMRFDDEDLENQAGITARVKHGVIAIKFQTTFAPSVIREIIFTKGEKGGDAAVAIVDPVILNGARFDRAKVPTLKNLPKVGDDCIILLSGGTVPVLKQFEV